jgi:hypothetical protein
LFPLTLTLPIALWGIDFDAIRRFELIFWAAFLIFLYILARIRLSFPLALLVVVGVGLSPYFFYFKDLIFSETLFIALLYGTFVVAAKLEGGASNAELPLRAGVWLGLMTALCVATRTVGVVMLPSFVVYDLVRFRRLRRPR